MGNWEPGQPGAQIGDYGAGEIATMTSPCGDKYYLHFTDTETDDLALVNLCLLFPLSVSQLFHIYKIQGMEQMISTFSAFLLYDPH